ncbi:sensor histidine kinase [Specibacter cremeus]|uniref:sensor histidine kinase n=1 Tax=Specibacter cremeus TaxID=1629051 RepID=UPI000F7BA34E|nr:sensor histidine kinase [Specibacter cremeus]
MSIRQRHGDRSGDRMNDAGPPPSAAGSPGAGRGFWRQGIPGAGTQDDARLGGRPRADTDPTLSIYSVTGYPLRGAWRQRGPRRWFFGAAVAVTVWLVTVVPGIVHSGMTAGERALVLANALAFLAVFVIVPPLSWGRTVPVRIGWLALLFALSLPFLAYRGFGAAGTWLWIFVSVAGGMQGNSRRITTATLLFLGVAALAVGLGGGAPFTEALNQPAVIVSVGAMVAAFARQREAVRVLRLTQHQLAELAVKEERNRVARDMHDILGHSLTVIAVKAELAGRLLETAPEKAAAEVADLEDLARGALDDVRATVSGYRGVNILSELANARTALVAAGIDADLPGAADVVPARNRELFGWVLREGVTNVIRHAGAGRCVVTLGAAFLQIDDDGTGPAAPVAGTSGGNGLAGLAERVAAAAGTLEVGRSTLGGYRLRLQL